jgi:NADH:ubiquinone oxidoreductase subunit 4 (subunit M)
VIFFFLTLWQQMPFLRTENTMAVLGSLGVLTVVFSGAWAVLQSSPSAVLGCAAMSALGIAVQGIAVGSDEALAGAMSVLIHRGMAILLASSALAALDSSVKEGAAKERSFSWPGLALLLIFLISVLALAVLPLSSHFGGGQHTDAALQASESRLMQAWWISSFGIVIGLARTSWQLWRDKVRVSAKPISIPVLVAIGLFLLWLWLESSPSLVWGWVSWVIAPFLPL